MLNIGFSPKASGFYPFGDAALPSEGGGIAKRLFFMFLFQSPQYLSTEPVQASERVGYDCEKKVDTTTDPLRGSHCVHIAITKLRVLARKDA